MTGTSLIWSALGWGMAALAVVFLLLAFLGDVVRRRIRRVRRCPKCWYDLSHTPGMTCSECGYTAKRERQLFRTRRRKRWVLVALLVWIGSYFAFRVPAMQQRGWVAAVPTTVLVFLWPRERVDRIQGLLLSELKFNGSRPYPLPNAAMSSELFYRIERGCLTRLDWLMLVEVAIRTHESPSESIEDFKGPLNNAVICAAQARGRLSSASTLKRALRTGVVRVSTRSRWPIGEEVWGFVWVDPLLARKSSNWPALQTRMTPLLSGLRDVKSRDISWWPVPHSMMFSPLGGGHAIGWPECRLWEDDLVALGQPPSGALTLDFKVSIERELTSEQREILGVETLHAEYVTRINSSIDGTTYDILSPMEAPEFETAMNERWRPSLHGSHLEVSFDEVVDLFSLLDGATFAVTIELLYGGEVVGKSEAWWRLGSGRLTGGRPMVLPFSKCVELTELKPAAIESPWREYAPFRVRLTPNPRMALRRFESDRYWAGQIDVPVSGQLTDEPHGPEPLYGGSWP